MVVEHLSSSARTMSDSAVRADDDLSFEDLRMMRARFDDVALPQYPNSCPRVLSAGELGSSMNARRPNMTEMSLMSNSSSTVLSNSSLSSAAPSPRAFVRAPHRPIEELAQQAAAERARRFEAMVAQRQAEVKRRESRRSQRLHVPETSQKSPAAKYARSGNKGTASGGDGENSKRDFVKSSFPKLLRPRSSKALF
mmetsp:Transcript_16114/g.34913  ORF Transcript_16114/g.34913 Transcript_16114/m.34913 type:complete len:196 (-) Transcript_16114:1301-1888(-)|eukprot:CAMPEP_0185848880 /NCGR_PEP_ID=MMETSP1354-20130828/3595_1 /TAXON_ID=708628 /ORGANISM="Erythrolobus madagascarensis, Strain CCMP3276" /LENGTH=195 /DNA_ID=CAMNT_0028549337 /DNA_START=183 /DNA_END=770 /DNA_ORIENTATION=+